MNGMSTMLLRHKDVMMMIEVDLVFMVCSLQMDQLCHCRTCYLHTGVSRDCLTGCLCM